MTEIIKIPRVDGWMDGWTDIGTLRGPRGPKKFFEKNIAAKPSEYYNYHQLMTIYILVGDVLA